MKIRHILSASALAGAVLLSATACWLPENNENHPKALQSASATPTATSTATSSSTTEAPAVAENGADTSLANVRVSAPTKVTITEVTNDSLKASWVAPANTVGKISQYSVLLKENGEVKGTYATAETSYTVTGLTPNNAYLVEVRALAVSDDGSKQATSMANISNTVVTRSPEPAAQTPNAPDAPASVPETPKASDSSSVEVGKVIATVNGYYNFVSSAGSLDKIKQSYDKVKQPRTEYDDPKPTDAELKQLVAGFPEGFRYFDTSSSENRYNAYNQLYARATQSERTPGTTVAVPGETVTVNGDNATVVSSKLVVTVNGKKGSATEAPYFEHEQLNLTKKSDGSWVIIAEAPRHTIP